MNPNVTILDQAIAFALFILFCTKYVWPPLTTAIEKRQREVADGLAPAKRAHKDLDLVEASATDQLKKAKAEAQIIIKQANKRCAQILDEAGTEAERERTETIVQTQMEIDVERKRAREELRRRVTILVIVGAEKIIERSMDEATNSDIVDRPVAEL